MYSWKAPRARAVRESVQHLIARLIAGDTRTRGMRFCTEPVSVDPIVLVEITRELHRGIFELNHHGRL